MKLYYHKTSGGAEYLFDTFIQCENGHKEGIINDDTKYVVRIDGDITKDAELTIKTPKELSEDNTDIIVCQNCGDVFTGTPDKEDTCSICLKEIITK